MKTKLLFTASSALLMAITTYAQPEPPAPGLMPGRETPRQGPARERPDKNMIRQVSVFTGEVGTWVTNDDYVYDGFYIQANGEKLLVRFPAAIGNQLNPLAKTGTSITVNGVADIAPTGEKNIRMVSITAAGKTFYDTPPAPPTVLPVSEFVTGTSKINSLQKNAAGDTNGFILDNKTILRLPPHVATQLAQTVTAGASISYTGLKKPLNNGELSSGNFNIVHCQTITVNGTQYLTR